MMFKSLDARTVIMLLEIICCGYSVVLGYLSDKKFGKIVNILLAIIWVVAAILNFIHY